MPRWLTAAVLLLAAGFGAAAAAAQDARAPWPWQHGSWRAGAIVDVEGGLTGDLRVAGARVTIRDAVRGDLAAAGAIVTLRGRVTGRVRSAGARIELDGQFEGTVDAAGAIVTLSERAFVADTLRLAGAEVEIDGHVAGNAAIAAANVIIGGTIDGDVDITAAAIEILPTARIGGRLVYRSPQAARIATGAEIAGDVVRETARTPGPMAEMMHRGAAVMAWLLRIGLFVLGLVLVGLFPAVGLGAARMVGTRPWATLGAGIAVLVLTPAVAALLACTVIGLPLAAMLMIAFALALIAAWIVAALWLGDGVLRLAWENGGFWRRALALLIGLVALGLLRNTPVAREIALVLGILLGIGALWLELRRRHRGA